MVSVPVPGAWHEEQIDELFASLLGKGFENSLPNGMGAESMQTTQDSGNSVLEGGFRVFG